MTKNLGQKMVFRRKPIVILKRAEHGLSPHSLISIFDFLTKIDFFRVGGGP